MSITKLRGKSALVQNDKTKSTTTTVIKGTTTASAAVTVAGTTTTATSTTITTTNTAQYLGGANISTKSSSLTTTTTTATSVTAAKLHNPCTANTAAAASNIQQQQQTYLPQTSLLKIEPFVPSFNARIRRRPIGRSYSTLSSTCIKRGGGGVGVGVGIGIGFMGSNATHLEGKNTAGILLGTAPLIDSTAAATPTSKAISRPVGRLRRNPVKIVARQRSKSTSSSPSNHRPTTAAAGTTAPTINVNHTTNATATTSTIVNGNGNGITAIVTPQPNGICRIARLPKEQEKLPDRINYDRRGLTAIPVFENEANLRLLSLQHNLINIFHIPKESAARLIEETAEAEKASKLSDDTNCNFNCRSNSRLSRTNSIQGRTTPINNSSTRLSLTLLATTNAGSTHILTPPSTATAAGSPLTMHPIPIGGSSVGSGSTSHINHLLNRNSIWQKKHINYHSPLLINTHQPHPNPHHHHHHQQQHQQPQYRFALKKSKSFITNYSRHLNHVRQNLQKSCFLTKIETNLMVAAALSATPSNLKSFDSGTSGIDSTSTLLSISEMEATAEDCCETARRAAQQRQLQLEIKNKQLMASYGEIFQNLVFLDLYDNQIERIGNLDGMPTLSVLLLGKNRIGDISGLASLRDTLRVLDLHGNKITSISNKINCLQELKSLNLAGNQIRQINQNDFNGLMNLKELNLKRNKIKRINGFQHLVALERLWLCHNDLHKVEDMSSIAKAINLLEVTIENNPVSLAGDCVSFLVSYLPRLQSLSQMPITEQVRRAALAWRKNKEISDANYSHLSSDVFNSIRREEVISNARTNWELLRSQQTVQSTLRNQRTLKQPELAKINESNEAVAVGYEELQEFIKLPPIQQQQQLQQSPQDAKQHNRERRLSGGSSGSSLGPNVDSSSSNYSSDVEESPKACGEVERARVKKCQKPISMRSRKEKASKLEASRTNTKQDETQINNSSTKCESGARDLNIIRTPTPLTISASNSTTTAAAEEAISKATESAAATQQQLTLMNSNQVDNNSSIQSKSNPNITMLPQTDIPTTSSYVLRTTTITTTTTTLRATTPTTQVTGSSSTLSLGFKENNVCHNTTTSSAASTATVPQQQTSVTAATTTIKAACKRYLKGSLIRSQTVVGGGGGAVIDGTGGKANSSSSHSNLNRGANNNNNGLQIQSHQNAAANNANGQTSGSSIVSTILAPATTLSTSSSKTCSNSKAAAANASGTSSATATTTEREREQGGDYLIEICGRYLNIYGQGALRYIDKQWNQTKANDVHTLNFSYINFNNIAATVLSRIKLRFPHAENYVFRETNISNLGQLNALAELQGIASLCIDPEGNAITTKDLWRQYAIYRLSHWGLKLLNGVEVTDADVDEANCMYAGLSDLVLWSMPEMMLQPLLARLRLDETCTASKMSPKEWLMKADNKSLRLVVGKEALQWKKTNDNNNNHQHYAYESSSNGGGGGGINGNASSLSTTTSMAAMASLTVRERGKIHFSQMMLNTCNAVEKLHKLETLWPSLLLDIVRNTLLDYSQLDEYLRNLMSEIMK